MMVGSTLGQTGGGLPQSPRAGCHCVLLIIPNRPWSGWKDANILPGPEDPPWQVQKPIQIVYLLYLLI